MRCRSLGLLGLVLSVWLLFATAPCPALAYQRVRVGPAGAKVHTRATSSSKVVGRVAAGTMINIGDVPTQGYYRCTVSARLSGWVRGSELALASSPRAANRKIASNPNHNEGPQYSVGLLAGFGVVTAGATGVSYTLGVEGIYHVIDEWSAGLYLTYIGFSGTPSATVAGVTASASESSTLIIAAPEASYDLARYLPGLRAVGIVGAGFVSSSVSSTVGGAAASSGSQSSVGLVLGAGGAYDYKLSPQWTVGGVANLIYLTAGGGGVDLNLFGSLRYWF